MVLLFCGVLAFVDRNVPAVCNLCSNRKIENSKQADLHLCERTDF